MKQGQKWQHSIAELFRYIFYAFFQPARLTRELQPSSRGGKLLLMLKLIVPMFVVACLITLVNDTFLLLLGQLKQTATPTTPLKQAFGIMFAIALGCASSIIFSITLSITFSVTLSIFAGIALGGMLSIAPGIIFGITFGIVPSISLIIAGNSTGRIVSTTTLVISLIVGFSFIAGIAVGIAVSIGFVLGLYRIPLYIVSGPSALYTYIAGRRRPQDVLKLLRGSSLHWDERVYLPLPFLKQTLLLAYDEDPQEALTEIAFIAAERPQQLRAARAAALEIALSDLEGRTTIQQIAGATQRLSEILPPEAKLSNPRWASVFSRVNDASREAMRSIQPISLSGRIVALQRMRETLGKIRPNVAFGDQRQNRRLAQIIAHWSDAAQMEYEHLGRATQEIGHIDNPYKPGQVLEPHDTLFVGRRDLAQQLEHALSKGSRRPTLLLQGERRMGKTSTLRQLTYLLGASYIPVVFNLQDPKLYARASTLLGTLANGIYDELIKRGIIVEPMHFKSLQRAASYSEPGQNILYNDPMTYSSFDRWLKRVVNILEEEDRSLLLAFDEFEKLDEAGEKGYLDLGLFLDWLREIIQFRKRIILLFSGVRSISDMGEKIGMNWSNYFVNVQTIKVSFLNEDEARHLILHPRPDYPGEEIFGTVVEQIIEQTHCHPFLLQALCSQIIDNLNAEQSQKATPAHVDQAAREVVEAWDGYFDDLWKRSDAAQRACLQHLDAQEWVPGTEIWHQSGLDEKSARHALRTLVRRDLAIIKDEQFYRISSPILNIWVKNNS